MCSSLYSQLSEFDRLDRRNKTEFTLKVSKETLIWCDFVQTSSFFNLKYVRALIAITKMAINNLPQIMKIKETRMFKLWTKVYSKTKILSVTSMCFKVWREKTQPHAYLIGCDFDFLLHLAVMSHLLCLTRHGATVIVWWWVIVGDCEYFEWLRVIVIEPRTFL